MYDEIVELATSERDARWSALLDDQRALWDVDGSSWVVLPAEGGFLAVSSDNEATRRMREVLAAFLGRHRVRDPLVHSAQVVGGRGVQSQYFAVTTGDRRDVLERLVKLVFVRLQNPRTVTPVANGLPTLLRDFFLALAAHSESEARRLHTRIAATGRLSIENVRFLEIRMLANFEYWKLIEISNDFDDLCRMRRPRAISDIMLEALWRRDLSNALELNGEEGARNRFRELKLGETYRSLLGFAGQPGRVRGRFILALHLGSVGEVARLQELVDAAPESERARLQRLAGSPNVVVEVTGADRESEARRCLDDGDYHGVLTHFYANPNSTRLAVLALEATAELDDSALAGKVLAVIDRHRLELPNRQRVAQLHEQVRTLANATISDWLTWARLVNSDSIPGINRVMLDESQQWSCSFMDSDAETAAVASAIEASIDGPNGQAVNSAVAALVQLASSCPTAAYASRIRSSVLLLIVNLDNAGIALREAVLELLRSARDGEWAPREMADAIDVVQGLWTRCASPFAVPWLVQALDEVLGLPGMSDDRARRIRAAIGSSLSEVHLRADPVWLGQLKSILGASFVLTWDEKRPPNGERAELDRVPWEALSGVRLGVYSLHNRIGQVEQLLKKVVPQLRLTIRQDPKWTKEMRDMLRNCDAFFYHWRVASHAGTELVDKHALVEPIMVPGVSVSSVLRCIEDFARRRQAMGAAA